MDARVLSGFVRELAKIAARRMDDRAGDTPSIDQTGRVGVNWRGPSGGAGEPPRPETADRFDVSNIQPADIAISSDRRSS